MRLIRVFCRHITLKQGHAFYPEPLVETQDEGARYALVRDDEYRDRSNS